MSQMLAEIRRIVNEDISNRISQYDIMNEGLTNCIHANATKIRCTLFSYDNVLQEDGSENGLLPRRVDAILIEDNGDGFSDANYNSFCKYRSEHKKDLGCKGVGRFTFLKIFKNVSYTSKVKSDQEIKKFKFDYDFDTNDIEREKASVKGNHTELYLSDVTTQYYNPSKRIERRIELDIEAIRHNVLLHLIPILFFYKKKYKRKISIEFLDNDKNLVSIITPTDIPEFFEEKFKVTKDQVTYDFVLYYQIKNEPGPVYSYYCADNRPVVAFAEKDFKISLPSGYSGYFLLESDYLDSHVNNERNDFDIFPVKTDIFANISWERINSGLKIPMAKIVNERIEDSSTFNREKLKTIQEERPYLMDYIGEDDLDMVGFLDQRNIIDKAKKKFDNAKENFLANSGKEYYSEKDLQEAIQIAQSELVSYIFDRVQVIERLKSLIDDKEKVEAIIHNLFMERHTEDKYYALGKNNLWLLDDRYTTYSYAASDKRINEVLKQLGDDSGEVEYGNDKPDLSLFFSHNPEQPDKLKSVLVEIKPFDYKSKADRKKFQGIQQLLDYVEAFKSKENIEEIWAFLITDIDEKFKDRLIGDEYKPLFSTSNPIYHRFYNTRGISIYVLDVKTLILDAEARNKIFLEIIKKKDKLNKLLT